MASLCFQICRSIGRRTLAIYCGDYCRTFVKSNHFAWSLGGIGRKIVMSSVTERLDIPDYTWSEKAKESNELLEKYAQSNNWERYILKAQTGETRTYFYFGNEKIFYGSMYFSVKEKAAKWSVTYGPWSKNGGGIVHGGLIATHHDEITGILAEKCFGPCVTANLNIKYKSPMPAGSTFLFECKVVKVEGRKIFLENKIISFETKKVVGDASALYVLVDLTKMEI